jgi:hypothetical protein
MSKKDRTPAEVKAVRRSRERRRIFTGLGFLAVWWALFIFGLVTGSDSWLWVGWLAVSGELIAVFGLYEKALRKLADRPAVDYGQLHKLEKLERKTRPADVIEQ